MLSHILAPCLGFRKTCAKNFFESANSVTISRYIFWNIITGNRWFYALFQGLLYAERVSFMAQKSKFDQFRDDFDGFKLEMQLHQVAQQMELQRQTNIQQQMADHQQATQFAVWKDTTEGRKYVAWVEQVQNIFYQVSREQAEFSKKYQLDLEAVSSEIGEFTQALEKGGKPFVIKFNWLMWLLILNLPLIFASIAWNNVIFLTNHSDSSVQNDGIFYSPLKAFGVGLLLEFLLFFIYPLVVRRLFVMLKARRAWGSASSGDLSLNKKISQCRWLISGYMTSKSGNISSNYDLVVKIYRNEFEASFVPRYWYNMHEVGNMSLVDYYRKFIREAPKNLPTNLPSITMPQPASSSEFHAGTHAANYLKTKYGS